MANRSSGISGRRYDASAVISAGERAPTSVLSSLLESMSGPMTRARVWRGITQTAQGPSALDGLGAVVRAELSVRSRSAVHLRRLG